MTMLSRESWLLAETLLDQALDLSSDARQRWLEDLKQRSPELAGAVEKLLAADEGACSSGFLEQTIVSQLGARLGAYRLERELGHGGMGTVWLASRCDGHFDGLVAIKLLDLSCASARGRRRFQREGSALARLSHPGIAKLLDAGVSGAGQPYLVLEYVDGQPIDVFARERGLDHVACIRLFMQVLAAVQHAHSNLVLHRDLKPRNILVTRDGAVKLLDFGIAKLLDPPDVLQSAGPSLEGHPFTPQYAAPEQVRGEALTTATDVYALGVLLYVLLSGRHPTSEGVDTPAECIERVLQIEPARLSLPELDNILTMSLRKLPAERYQSVAALEDDLSRYLRREPIRARAPSLVYATKMFVRRHWLPLGFGLTAALSLVAVAALALGQMYEARAQKALAQRQRKLAEAQVEFQSVLLSSGGERGHTTRELLDLGRTVLERSYTSDSGTMVPILIQLSSHYAELDDVNRQTDLLRWAERLAQSGPGRERLAEIRCGLVDTLRLRGEYDQAWTALRDAESLLSETSDPSQRAACLAVRSLLASEVASSHLKSMELADMAIDAAQQALALLEALDRTRSTRYLELLSALASAFDVKGNPRRAVDLERRASALMEMTGRSGLTMYCISRHNMACSLVKLGETQRAEEMLTDVAARTANSDPGHIEWQPTVHLAEVELTQLHPASALTHFRALVDRAVAEKNLFWEGRGLYGVARAELQLGRPTEARAVRARLMEIITVYPHVLDTDDVIPDISVIDGLIANAAGDYASAHQHFVLALRNHGYDQGKHLGRLRPVIMLAAEAALAIGNSEEAGQLCRQALKTAEVDELCETHSSLVGAARLLEARIQWTAGDFVAALGTLARAIPALENGSGSQHPHTREAKKLRATLEQCDLRGHTCTMPAREQPGLTAIMARPAQ